MGKIYFFLGVTLLALTQFAHAGLRTHGTSTIAPYLGAVATRTQMSVGTDTTNLQFNSRAFHIARSAITSLKLVVPNFTGYDGAIGSSVTYFASIEYPAGTFTRVTWNSGSTSISVANNGTAVSDFVNVSIPNGATFFTRFFATGVSAVPVMGQGKNTTGGDALNIAASGLSDQTMSGTITNNSGNGFWPAAIVANITTPSIAILGDSIAAGFGDSPTASGDWGSIARSIGGSFGYLNLGVSGDTASGYVSTHSLRSTLVQYASHVIIEYGTNDIFVNHNTAAQLTSSIASIMALFPTKKIVLVTITPKTTSTDSWATVANQTTVNATDEASRVTYNTSVRAGVAGAIQFSEIANVVESSLNSGKWLAPPAQTADGIHPNPGMYQTLIGSTNTAWFTYP